jgi:CheY-like chemotaxis protein
MPKVLVVDDDPDLVAICSFILESEGYEVGVARNGFEALDRIARDGIDLVLLDAMMPAMDGITVCRLVRDSQCGRRVPVVIMSASQIMCERAKQHQADAVLPKPFSIDELLGIINRLTQSPRPAQSA